MSRNPVVPDGNRRLVAAVLCLLCLVAAPGRGAEVANADRVTTLGPVPDGIHREFVAADGRSVAWLISSGDHEVLMLDGHADPFFGAIKSAPVISPDGRRMAYKVDAEGGAKRALVADGKVGPAYASVENASIRFSADSRHLCYSAADADGRTVLVRDGQVMAQGPDIRSDAVTSRDFSHVAYKTAVGERRCVVLDGRPGPQFPQVDNYTIAFSPSGDHLVYLARDGQENESKAIVVVDQVPGEVCDRVSGITFSPDDRHVAYVATRGGRDCVVVDGKPGAQFESIDPFFLRFAPDGAIGYRARQDGRMRVVVGTEVVAEADGILDWAAAGANRAVIGVTGDSWWVQSNGRRSETYTRVAAPLAMSPDGAHLAYAARQGTQWQVVLDGQPTAAWDNLAGPPVFSADGSHWGYVGRRGGQWFVVVDGRADGPYDWFLYGSPQFGPDGRHTAYAGRAHSRWRMVLDGKTVAEGDDIAPWPLRFGADGQHFACALRAGDQWRMVVDGVPGPPVDRLFDRVPPFGPDGSLEYPAIRGKMLCRVTHSSLR